MPDKKILFMRPSRYIFDVLCISPMRYLIDGFSKMFNRFSLVHT